MNKLAYTVFANSPQGGSYNDEIYADPRGAANAAILALDSHPEITAVIITRVSIAVADKKPVLVDSTQNGGHNVS